MPMPRSYLVRVYRQGFDFVGGTVQDVTTSEARPFANLAELGELLLAPIEPAAAPEVGMPADRSTSLGG